MASGEMSDAKKGRLIQIAAIVAGVLLVVGGALIVNYGGQKQLEAYLENIQGNQVNHLESSRVHEEKQDLRIDDNERLSRDNELEIRLLGPLAKTESVTRSIALVQHAIECEIATCDDSCWVHVPGASADSIPDDVRSRVEEYFRRLGYDVCRERPVDGGEFRGFWIFVKQT